jgi:hypothetical protein
VQIKIAWPNEFSSGYKNTFYNSQKKGFESYRMGRKCQLGGPDEIVGKRGGRDGDRGSSSRTKWTAIWAAADDGSFPSAGVAGLTGERVKELAVQPNPLLHRQILRPPFLGRTANPTYDGVGVIPLLTQAEKFQERRPGSGEVA